MRTGDLSAEPRSRTTESFPFLQPTTNPTDLGQVGSYPILKLLGQGGMGMVFQGVDPTLGRLVAIKVMAPHLAASATSRERFLREAQAAAAVRHSHVVAIHAVAETEGIPYLVMQFIAGRSLQDQLDRDGPLPPLEAARIGLQMAQGLAAAHAQGLVHRDVKPANVLFENATDQVKITDFGLARAVDDVSLTQSGVITGTPAFMSPEQARGEPVDHRTDLFSLGSVLYALCTGQAPFRARKTMDLLRCVCEETPRPVCEVNPDVPGWLAAVIERLHAKDPGQRFASAEEVAGVLDYHLARLAAAPPAPRPRLRRGLLAAGVFLLFLLAGGAAVFFSRPRTVPPELEPGADIVPDSKLANQRLEPSPEVKAHKVEIKELPATRDVPAPTPPTQPAPQVQLIHHSDLTGEKGKIAGLALAPDGKTLAAGQKDGVIQLWTEQARSWKPATTLKGHKGAVITLAFSANGQMLASGGTDRTVRLWKKAAAGWEEAGALEGHTGDVYGLAFAPEGATLFTAAGIPTAQLAQAKPGEVKHWDLEHGEELTLPTMPVLSRAILSLGLAPDGQTLAIGYQHAYLRLWNLRTSAVLAQLPDVGCLYGLAWSPDGKMLASGGCDGTVKVWSLGKGAWKWTRSFPKQANTIRRLAFDREGKLLLSFAAEGDVRFWDLAVGEAARLTRPATDRFEQAAFAPECRRVAAATACGTIQVWDYVPGPNLGIPAFVVLARAGRPEQRSPTLAEAVGGAQSGDTIEVRGNGPFVADPIMVRNKDLVIRAGEGFTPVISLNPDSTKSKFRALLTTYSSLVLEGLELRRSFVVPDGGDEAVIRAYGPRILLANCRLSVRGPSVALYAISNRDCELRNCLVSGTMVPISWIDPRPGGALRVENCAVAGEGISLMLTTGLLNGKGSAVDVRVSRTTWAVGGVLEMRFKSESPDPMARPERNPILWEAGENVFDFTGFHVQTYRFATQPPPARTSELLLAKWLTVREQNNVYGSGSPVLRHSIGWKWQNLGGELKTLAEWQRFSKTTGSAFLTGKVRYAHGDPRTKLRTSPETVTAEDFRLHPDSPGWHRGPGGRDLGADLDLVGPGPAYERWQKTPDYQAWLKRTGQVK